jgi:hypothetical protein
MSTSLVDRAAAVWRFASVAFQNPLTINKSCWKNSRLKLPLENNPEENVVETFAIKPTKTLPLFFSELGKSGYQMAPTQIDTPGPTVIVNVLGSDKCK